MIENNRVRFEILRRFGVFPGSGDHHSVEFMPGFVHPGNDYGRGWRVHHYGMEGHRADAAADVEHYEAVRDADDVTRMPSGELVATLLDGMVSGKARALPVNLPNAGNVTNLADGAVVEIMGIADGDGVRGRDRATVPGIMGEFLRRINIGAGVDGRGRAHRRPHARAGGDDGRSDGRPARLRRHRHDDRRDARRHRPLAPPVRLTVTMRWSR